MPSPAAHRLRRFAPLFVLLLPLTRAAGQPTPVPDSALFRRVSELVAADSAFSGVVALGRNGRVVHLATAGRIRPAGKAPDAETPFNIGSITKAFTGIVVQQLATEQGWSLDATLASVWPDYPNAAVASAVTIRQILTHRAGITGNIFAPGADGTRRGVRGNADVFARIVREPLAFAPGSQEDYSNAGYVVLGALIEQRTRRSYYDVLSERIYRPAGMTQSGHYMLDSLPPAAAEGLTRSGGTRQSNAGTLPGRGTAAGGSYASALDLLRFVQALRERRLPQGPPPGLGIAGGSPGVNAILEGALPGGLDLVVLANVDPPAAERIARAVRAMLGVADD